MSGSGKFTIWKAILSLLVSHAMVWGLVPVPALAEMVNGDGNDVVALNAEQGTTVDNSDEMDSQDETQPILVEPPTAATDLVYDGTSLEGVPEGEGYELSGTASATEAGDYIAVATPAKGYLWDDGTDGPVEISWSVARRQVTVTADDKLKLEGDSEPELTATIEGLVGDDALVYELSREPGEDVGEYTITPVGEETQGNYKVEYVAGTLTIEGAEAVALQEGDAIVSGTWGTCPWEIDSNGTLMVYPGEGESQSAHGLSPWDKYRSSIRSIVFVHDDGARVVLPANSCNLFSELKGVVSIDSAEVDTSNVTNMSGMFRYCSGLKSLDLSAWEMSSVTNISDMFYNCSSLSSVDGLSAWDTSSVTSMDAVFQGCSKLTALDLSGWDTSGVTKMNGDYPGDDYPGCGMFYGCSRLTTLDLSGWDTSNMTDMAMVFYGCSRLTTLDLSGWDTANVEKMVGIFYGCTSLESLNLSGWDTSGVTDMIRVFYGCSRLRTLDLSGWDTSNVEIMAGVFYGCTSLESLNLSGWDTSNMTEMSGVFRGCSSLATLDLSGWDTSRVTSISSLFSGCSSLDMLDLSGWDTSSVYSTTYTFSGCSSLETLDLSEWDMSDVTYMANMFHGCSSLSTLDLSGWDTSGVTNMVGLFSGCSSLSSLDLSGWDVSGLTSMREVFSGCSKLAVLDLSGWDTSNVTDMSYLFSGCSSLSSLDLSGWDTSGVVNTSYMFSSCSLPDTFDLSRLDVSSVVDMSHMFSSCSSTVPLDLSAWDTSSVKKMVGLFQSSKIASLDLSGWDTSGIKDMSYVFCSCSKLESLDLSGWDTMDLEECECMFEGCSSLKQFKVGVYFEMQGSWMVPEGSASNHMWFSTRDKKWFTRDEIGKLRSGIADTYVSVAEPGYEWDISTARVYDPEPEYRYTGRPIASYFTVYLDGYDLRKDVDYFVTYKDNVNVGTATIVITGQGNYKGTVTASFQIIRATTAMPQVIDRTYNGKTQVGVTTGAGYALSGTYKAVNAGTYTAYATPDANHCWSDGTTTRRKITWKIAAKTVTPSLSLSRTRFVYSGRAQKPTVTVKVGTTKLTASQYAVAWPTDAKSVGAKSVKVTLRGNYTGSKSVSYTIVPKGTSVTKLTPASRALTVTWARQAAQTTGYQVQYGTARSFKGAKTVTVASARTTSKKLTGLSAKRTYYVRIRTYKKVGTRTYYSAWSSAKYAKTK